MGEATNVNLTEAVDFVTDDLDNLLFKGSSRMRCSACIRYWKPIDTAKNGFTRCLGEFENEIDKKTGECSHYEPLKNKETKED